MEDNSNNKSNKHLIVMQHGLHGVPNDFYYIKEEFIKEFTKLGVMDRYELLLGDSNHYFLATHEGIDACGKRLAKEIVDLDDKFHFSKISLIGHSLGGLIIRSTIGELYKLNFFTHCEADQFITLSSPHLGSRRPGTTFFNKIANTFVTHLISTTGRQLAFEDDPERPFLLQLTQNEYLQGLQLFKTRTLYSNILNDIQVTFCTSDISHSNPYTKIDQNLWEFSTQYPHLIKEPIAFSKFEKESQSLLKDEKGHFIRDALYNLQTLEFKRYHAYYPNPLSHTNVVVKRKSINAAGVGLISHLIDNFNKD